MNESSNKCVVKPLSFSYGIDVNKMSISAFSKKSSQSPSSATKELIRNNIISDDKKVTTCWEPRDKYDVFYDLNGPSIEKVYMLSGESMIIFQTKDPEQQYISMEYKKFQDKLVISETRILFSGVGVDLKR